jgi:hypothetical protein
MNAILQLSLFRCYFQKHIYSLSNAISAYHNYIVSLYPVQARCTPVSSTNKTDCHDITEILLKVALSTITQVVV